MSQSLSQLYVHVIFSTKHRTMAFPDRAFRVRVHAYLANACRNHKCAALAVGGVEDHVHILCRLHSTVAAATLVRELKRESSKWIKAQQAHLKRFCWQGGYGAFSISPGHVQALIAYIERQEEHHRRVTFQDEFRRIGKKYGVQIDERYVWD